MKTKSSCKLLLVILIALMLNNCRKEEDKEPEPIYEKIDFNIELKDNIASLSWNLNDKAQINNISIGRLYATKKSSFEGDELLEYSEKELLQRYDLNFGESVITDNSGLLTNYNDSLFSYRNEFFYTISISGNNYFGDSNFRKVNLPELPVFNIAPTKVLYDPEVNDLYFIDKSNTVKLYKYSVDDNKLTLIHDSSLGANYSPESDISIGELDGKKKLLFTELSSVYIFDLTDLSLELKYTFDNEYFGSVVCDSQNSIFVVNADGSIFKIDYKQGTISKIFEQYMYSEFHLVINNGFIYLIGIKTSYSIIEKFQILSNGNLTLIKKLELEEGVIEHFDYSHSKEIILFSNGLSFDKDLTQKRILYFPPSTKIFAFSQDGNSVWINKPSTKYLYLMDIATGKKLVHKNLLSYPNFIVSGTEYNINIGKFKINYEPVVDYPDIICIETFN